MSQGLPLSDAVNVQINMAPIAAAMRNFGSLLILGPSPVIGVTERVRPYTMDGLNQEFGMLAPETQAANLYFSQQPKPTTLYVGRWAKTATSGQLIGATLTSAQQALSNFTSIKAGGLQISVDGTAKSLTAIDLTGVTSMNGVAGAITTALSGVATVAWNAPRNRFEVVSASNGSASSLSYATPPATGTDLSALVGLNQGFASAPVAGINAESLAAAVQACATSIDWYGLLVADPSVTGDSVASVSAYIEAATPSRVFGITSQDPGILDPTNTTDIASRVQALKYQRTFVQYSSSSAFAAASIFGRAFTVDFTANNSTITLKFKQEPGVTAETLTPAQAATLRSKSCNAFVNYSNSTAIIIEGTMANGYFFDEVHGLDWLQNQAQTNVFNELYLSPTKIPQTDPGLNRIAVAVERACEGGVTNGLIAPGVWNAPGFGAITQGQTLTKGYYVYMPPVASQNVSDRAARKAPTMQVAVKLAGAVHFANVIINVNR